PQQRLLHRLAHLRQLPPALLVEPGERGAILRRQRLGAFRLALAIEPGGKAGRRRQGDEGLEPRVLPRNLLHHLLDQEIAERHAGEATLAVGDRIERRGVDLVRLDAVALHRQDRRDRVGYFARQRDLDEDQRLVQERGMEER